MKVELTKLFVKRSLLLSTVLALCGAVVWLTVGASESVTAQAPPTRIAVIDVQKVLTQSTAGKASVARLKQLQDDRLAKARVMDTELRNLTGSLAAGRATMTPAKISDLERQIAEKQTAMKRFGEDAQKEINSLRDRELQALEARINPIVNGAGKEMGLAAIFNKFESGLIFANDAIDITDTIIARFNAAGPAAPPAR